MSRSRCVRSVAAAFISIVGARSLHAQIVGRSVELSGTVATVGGVAPVSIDGASHAGLYGGLRFDGGIQGERLEMGAGVRVWEFAPTHTYGGHGVAGFLSGEWRVGGSRRNAVRASAGAGFDQIDPGRGPYRENTGTSGFEWSLGFGHEATAPLGARVVMSADLVMPSTNAAMNGRRLPVLELGFGYRLRRYQSIR